MERINITFQEFKEKWNDGEDRDIYERKGQYLMNSLYVFWPEEYKRITGTNNDCFYNDSLIPNTLKHLEEVWPTIK